MTLDAPLLAVVGGSTGAGKSTLVNSLVGAPGHRARRAAAHHPLAGAGAPPRRRRLVRPGPAAARPRAGRPRRPTTRRRSSWSPSDDGARRAWRSSTPPTSTRSRSATARWPPSCSPPPTSGCSSPPPRGTPTRCRGTSCARPPSARTAVAIVLDRTPAGRGRRPSPPTWPGCWPAAGSRTRRCSSSPRARSTTTGCCPPTAVADIRGWLESLAADADARAAVVKQTLDGAIRTLTRRTHDVADAAAEQVAAVRRLREDADTAYDEAVDGVVDGLGRRHPAARRGAGPLAGVRRHRRAAQVAGDPGRLAARPDRQRRQGQAAAGRAGHRRRRVRPRDADPRARRGRRRARRGVVAVAGAGPGAARRRRRGPRPRLARPAPPGRARGARLAAGRARDGPHRGRRQAHAPRASSPTASTGCRSR